MLCRIDYRRKRRYLRFDFLLIHVTDVVCHFHITECGVIAVAELKILRRGEDEKVFSVYKRHLRVVQRHTESCFEWVGGLVIYYPFGLDSILNDRNSRAEPSSVSVIVTV